MIQRNLSRLLLSGLVSASFLFAGQKPHDWHNAKVLDTKRTASLMGFMGSSQTDGSSSATVTGFGNMANVTGQSSQQTYSRSQAVYAVNEYYAFDDGQYIYYTNERPKLFRWSKPARLIVNGTAQIAVERDKLFVIDQDGKQHETRIVKQIAKS